MKRDVSRLRDERGAVNVMVALLIIPIIGFAAIAVDVAALWSDRQQLQTAADAAALGIASDCALGDCGVPAQTAQTLATPNKNDGDVTATVLTPAVTPATGTVTVETWGTREHWFAPVLGYDESDVGARATAVWGSPSAAIAMLPLAFSWCEFLAQTGGALPSTTTEYTIKFTKTSGTTCTGPSNNVVPGGFGWLTVNEDSCTTSSSIDEVVYSDPGQSVPSGCNPADFAEYVGKTVLVPIFDDAGDTGSNAWYHLYGYAAFMITGYHFTGQYSESAQGDCKGNVRCIQGYFTEFVDLSQAATYSGSAPELGATVVSLTD
ncbi:Tad domain-containing protein [Antribacter sp. KLBMP9083]|uniref:Tad domain-containing protein n=1 Tax=Antribacter soli TaxID=2910976 RepID=A0AA41QGQ9_9MICO|nr:pilus assembly protein TadG-related protein [Antribacter soli]MCF4122813.1 Tad domain-containing protein [Antribacter soli]